MDHKTSGPYKHYERPSKGRAEGMKPTQNDRGWKIGVWLFAIILIILLPVTYQLSAKNIHKTEQATEVQKVSKPVSHKKKPNNKSSIEKNKKITASTKSEKNSTYEVQDGDTLSSIAAQNNMTVEQLEKLNGLNDTNSIKVGQTLKIK